MFPISTAHHDPHISICGAQGAEPAKPFCRQVRYQLTRQLCLCLLKQITYSYNSDLNQLTSLCQKFAYGSKSLLSGIVQRGVTIQSNFTKISTISCQNSNHFKVPIQSCPMKKKKTNKLVYSFAPGEFAEKGVLKLVKWFSGHGRAIKS